MNPRMWAHPATRANAETLARRGVELVGPDEGETAEGEWGVGRMAEPAEIARADRAAPRPGQPRRARRVLVTAGGTREPLDAVRFLGNRSSGRMGVALAEEARRRGAEVVLLAANLAVPAPAGVETIETPTAAAMLEAALARADSTSRCSRRPSPTTGRSPPLAEKRPKGERAVDGRARADGRHRARSSVQRKRPGQLLVAFGAELGAAGLERKRAHARGQERRPRRLQRRLPRRHRLRRGRQRGRAR